MKFIFALGLSLALGAIALADAPQLINYQGKLTDPSGNPVADGTYSVDFHLYDAPVGGVPQWGEVQNVTTKDGLFSVTLGSVIGFGLYLFNNSPLYLAIKVGSDPELSPRTLLTSVPYALSSNSGWRDDGTSVSPVTLTDKIGVGTSSPATALHVVEPNGDAVTSRFESSNTQGTILEMYNSSSLTKWLLDVTGTTGGWGGAVANGDMVVYMVGGGYPSVVYHTDGTSTFGDAPHLGRISAGTPFDTIAGYFTTSANTNATHVIHSEYTGFGNYDASAVYGKCAPAPFYGYGGRFEGGFTGVRGEVNQNGTGSYFGVNGYATGTGTAIKFGVYGTASGLDGNKYGVFGASSGGNGTKYGVYGEVYNGVNCYAGYFKGNGNYSTGAMGDVLGDNAIGVYGWANGYHTTGVSGYASGNDSYGIFGSAAGTNAYAGAFQGNVIVVGTLSKSAGSFKIDHPLDPENKYLQHSFVESPDMKNIYDGVVTMDANGAATVALPDWFDALNEDFRYQLTCVGGYAPVYVSSEIADNTFSIAGGTPGLKVSWQVTGIRHDVYAEAHRIQVEVNKSPDEKGKYLTPELYGADKTMAVGHHPELLDKPAEETHPLINGDKPRSER